jgi:hypothetical protein
MLIMRPTTMLIIVCQNDHDGVQFARIIFVLFEVLMITSGCKAIVVVLLEGMVING